MDFNYYNNFVLFNFFKIKLQKKDDLKIYFILH